MPAISAAGSSFNYRGGPAAVREWARELLWLAVIVIAIVAYSASVGVAWPIAVVSSYSMEPTLRLGDFVFLSSAACETLKPGDVVVYSARNPLWAGSWIIHRVHQKLGGGTCALVTWGDNNNAPDQSIGEPPVDNRNIIGRVVLAVPYVGVFPLVVRPQGIDARSLALWLLRLVAFSAAVMAFYVYFRGLEGAAVGAGKRRAARAASRRLPRRESHAARGGRRRGAS